MFLRMFHRLTPPVLGLGAGRAERRRGWRGKPVPPEPGKKGKRVLEGFESGRGDGRWVYILVLGVDRKKREKILAVVFV